MKDSILCAASVSVLVLRPPRPEFIINSVWRAVSSHHPQEDLLAQFSLHVHKSGLKPHSFHFYLISNGYLILFQRALAFPMLPVAFFMGVERADCLEVGRLLGSKLILTDLVAYQQLGEMIRNRQNDVQPYISVRNHIE